MLEVIQLFQRLITNDVMKQKYCYGLLMTNQARFIAEMFIFKAEKRIFIEVPDKLVEVFKKKINLYKIGLNLEILDTNYLVLYTKNLEVLKYFNCHIDSFSESKLFNDHLKNNRNISRLGDVIYCNKDLRHPCLGYRMVVKVDMSDKKVIETIDETTVIDETAAINKTLYVDDILIKQQEKFIYESINHFNTNLFTGLHDSQNTNKNLITDMVINSNLEYLYDKYQYQIIDYIDLNEKSFIPKFGMDYCFSENKGCYIGQEVIAMSNRSSKKYVIKKFILDFSGIDISYIDFLDLDPNLNRAQSTNLKIYILVGDNLVEIGTVTSIFLVDSNQLLLLGLCKIDIAYKEDDSNAKSPDIASYSISLIDNQVTVDHNIAINNLNTYKTKYLKLKDKLISIKE